MAKRVLTKQILDVVGCPNLSLYKGDGYWYFVYDDGADKFATRSVYAVRLSDLSLETWVAEGRELVAVMEGDS